MNLLIAIMNFAYERVERDAVREFSHEKAKIIMEVNRILPRASPTEISHNWLPSLDRIIMVAVDEQVDSKFPGIDRGAVSEMVTLFDNGKQCE